MEEKNKEEIKSFSTSNLSLENRKILKITGVEKIFETNENKVQIRVAGSSLIITGNNLSVEKLDVNLGNLELSGTINELKYYSQTQTKTNFFKKIFK